ncbi:hypothetical protein J7W19_18210 [Streptomyces mobaraensis NBRC 13819 = DSM 40847]|nr:hypothetical protein [Streptomyces mobaraensis]QTT75057.1 hypothetical protein J7W19_18210 [Streptomyces mobaraensis NBRC 13819 = DSM 40847]
MGSLRNPIGPLPSSIYWRRRGVALAVLGLLALLVVWLLTLGGEDGSSDGKNGASKGGSDSGGATITPGPTPSGPHYSQRPGGRDESNGAGGTGSSGGSGGSGQDQSGSVGGLGSVGGGSGGGAGGTGGGSGGGAGSAGGAGGSGGTGGGFGAGPAAGVLGAGDAKVLAKGASVPDCTSGSFHVTVRSVKGSYGPGERPKFEIVLKNTGSGACKVDIGSPTAVLKITDPAGTQHVWASDDCPRGRGEVLVEVPGSGETKRTLEWDRKRSAPQCAVPSAGAPAAAGTYRVEVKIGGVVDRGQFVLDKG